MTTPVASLSSRTSPPTQIFARGEPWWCFRPFCGTGSDPSPQAPAKRWCRGSPARAGADQGRPQSRAARTVSSATDVALISHSFARTVMSRSMTTAWGLAGKVTSGLKLSQSVWSESQ